MSRSGKYHGPCLRTASLLLLSMACVQFAQAAPPTASATAWDMDVNVSVAGAPVLDLGAQNTVQYADKTDPFTQSVSALSFDSGAGSFARLKTGDITVSAQWNPGESFQVVGAQASIANLDLGVVGIGNNSLLSVGASQLVATALVSGSCPADVPVNHLMAVGVGPVVDDYIYNNGFEEQNLQPSGVVDDSGLAVALQGTALLNIPTNPAPNTTLSLPLGVLSLTLNEQTVTGDGITSRGVANNALHLEVNVLGIITAHVVLSHAEASITCH